jgi:hypothetical protein
VSGTDRDEAVAMADGDPSGRVATARSASLGGGGIALMALCLAVACLFVRGYSFSDAGTDEQLPLVYRALDPLYLPRDFYVEANQAIGPRSYFVLIVAALARVAPLECVYLALTVLSNAGVLAVTYLAARRLTPTSSVVPIVACVLVAGVVGPTIGNFGGSMVAGSLVPGTIAIPLGFGAVLAALRGHPMACALLAAAAALSQPVIGMQAAVLGLSVAVALCAAPAALGVGGSRGHRGALALQTAVAAAAFAGFCQLVWFARRPCYLGVNEFIAILGRLRSPHHYLPSQFPYWEYRQSAAFLASGCLAWWQHRRSRTAPDLAARLVVAAAVIGLLWVGGYVFVEVWPSRLWVTAHLFRLMYVATWLSLLLVAASVVGWWGRATPSGRAAAAFSCMATGPRTGYWFLVGQVIGIAQTRLRDRWARPVSWAIASVCAAAGAWAYASGLGGRSELRALLLLGALGACAWYIPRRSARATGAMFAALAFIIGCGIAPRGVVPGILQLPRPHFTVPQSQAGLVPLSAWLQANTPADTLLVAPPRLEALRVTARRALVVDFQCFPFQDEAMVEWRSRILTCYGPVSGGGFPAAEEMDRNWHAVTDERLERIARAYGAGYAVLYASTATRYPTLAVIGEHRVVALR